MGSRAQALRARPRRRALPKDEGQRSTIAPNALDREFHAERPNQRWIADFTYVWTAEGWLYVAAVIDLFSRRVVGWSMKAEMTAGLVTDALVMAIWRRGKPDALLHHSDQGSPIREPALPGTAGRKWRHLFHEPIRQRVGQCSNGELLLLAQDRTD
jgi:transposase InsO family protein